MEITTLNQSLSASLSFLRTIQEKTREEFASELDISKTTLVNIENNRGNPTLATVEHIAKHLGVDPIVLLAARDSSGLSSSVFVLNFMSSQQPGNSLGTLQQAIDHFQAALDLLYLSAGLRLPIPTIPIPDTD